MSEDQGENESVLDDVSAARKELEDASKQVRNVRTQVGQMRAAAKDMVDSVRIAGKVRPVRNLIRRRREAKSAKTELAQTNSNTKRFSLLDRFARRRV